MALETEFQCTASHEILGADTKWQVEARIPPSAPPPQNHPVLFLNSNVLVAQPNILPTSL